MKAGSLSIDERKYLEIKQKIYDEFKRDVEQLLRDRETMAGCRAQWMLLVADYRRHGHGKKRLEGTIEEVGTMLESLYADREAEVMDETLILDLERIGFDVRKNFAEYFECAERLKNFGKFIDKEKEASASRKKEKELLKKLNINLNFNMMGRKFI